MDTSVITFQVVVLFLIMILGYIVRKLNIINQDVVSGLSNLVLLVTQPLLIVTSFNYEFSAQMLENAAMVLALSFGIHFFAILVAKFLFFKYDDRMKNVLKYATVFANCGFMGFPILDSIFGGKGVFYGSIYVIGFNVMALSYGVMIFTGKSEDNILKKILTHPIIISVAVGLFLFIFQIDLPAPIFEAASSIGSMTSPLSMLIVGAMLVNVPIKDMFKGVSVYYGSFARLVIIPLLTLGILKLLPLPSDVFYTCVVLLAMPSGAYTVIYAERYGGDAGLASRIVGISTILSIATIPLILSLI